MRASVLAVLLFCASGPRQPLDDAVSAIPGSDPAHLTGPCNDGEYLRRLSLDLLGYPPNATEAAAFIKDATSDKRAHKLDEFLATPRFADLWARRSAEVFFGNYHEPDFDLPDGLKIETRRRLLTEFISWLREQIHADRPWPDIMTSMLVARGSSAAVPELAYKLSFYGSEKQEFQFAAGVSRHFLGINLHCASCHPHPYGRWKVEDFFSFAAFNTRQRAERSVEKDVEQVLVRYVDDGEFEPYSKRKSEELRFAIPRFTYSAKFLRDPAPAEGEWLQSLSDSIRNDKEKAWARALGNRTWTWLIGRGVYEPSDDFSMKNKLASARLLDTLICTVEEGKGSLKSLVRAICSTETYQRSSESAEACNQRHYCRGAVLPLTGEQMLNSIQVALRGAPGLDLQEAQDLTGALTMRPQGVCEVQPLPCGTLHALMFRNSDKLWEWLRSSTVLAGIRQASLSDDEVIDRMFLAALTRKPTATERTRYAVFLRDRGNLGVEDAYWTLMNTAEFLTRH
jgi:hypothetical protein